MRLRTQSPTRACPRTLPAPSLLWVQGAMDRPEQARLVRRQVPGSDEVAQKISWSLQEPSSLGPEARGLPTPGGRPHRHDWDM